MSKCVRSSRFFLNRLLKCLRSMEDKGMVPLPLEAKTDFNWFLTILPTFNGVTVFELDASLQGLGAVWGDQTCAITVPLGWYDFLIVHLEMLNILVALVYMH